jgi:hypothetical protein
VLEKKLFVEALNGGSARGNFEEVNGRDCVCVDPEVKGRGSSRWKGGWKRLGKMLRKEGAEDDSAEGIVVTDHQTHDCQ